MKNTGVSLQTKQVNVDYDVIAPDGSEIRLLTQVNGGEMCHCTLPLGEVSKPVAHSTVEEIWYFISGQGQVWRKFGDFEEIIEALPGCSVSIPLGASFQFRNLGDAPLCFIIVTIPQWPGEQEVKHVPGPWGME